MPYPDEPTDTVMNETPEAAESEPVELAEPQLVRQIEPADAGLAEAVGDGLTWIPYAVYLAGWLGLAGASAYLLNGASAENPARWMPAYAPLVWTGVALVALGPILSLVVWLVARRSRPTTARRGLFASALIRGALTAFFGVVIWLVTLYVLELAATGSIS